MRSLNYFINNPFDIIASAAKKIKILIPDKLYLKILFRSRMGYKLNLNKPETYSEKLQWLKLYDRRPEYTVMVDKYAVKDFVASIIGEEYIIPTLGVWDKPSDIDWDILPNQFVLKSTHDSGGVVICKNKDNLDKKKAIKKLKKSIHRDYYLYSREWPYKNVPRRIIAEKFIEPDSSNNDLPDYKFFCFDGDVKAMFVATARQVKGEEVKFDFFDADFNHLPFRQGHDHAKQMPQKPVHFEEMKKMAAELSKGYPHMRVDFYESNNSVLFGELTLYHFSGMTPFEPKEWDLRFGEMLSLPIVSK